MTGRPSLLRALFLPAALLAATGGGAAALESAWVEGYNFRTRLHAGHVESDGASRLFAFVEIELPTGWKTYWRTPGDAGGLPPTFDWSKSLNVAEAKVRYPAPHRFVDKAGNTIGYKGRVIFPVEITPKDPAKPFELGVAAHFGICKDICVPIEAELGLEVPADDTAKPSAAALEALAGVPRAAPALAAADPVLTRAEAVLGGDKPHLVLEARFPGDAAKADIFLEAEGGLYMPLPLRTKDGGDGNLTFEADLSADVDLAALTGKEITATLVGDGGASVATFPLR